MSELKQVVAIDPGNVYSGYCLMDALTYKPLAFDKVKNETLLDYLFYSLCGSFDDTTVAIEMIAHYGSGMPAGKTVFDTCVWIGRFIQIVNGVYPYELVYRTEEKMTLCGSTKANDATIRQALVDRFAPDTSNHGKGTKKEPGWFYGFKADVWQAYAVGVTYLDLKRRRE